MSDTEKITRLIGEEIQYILLTKQIRDENPLLTGHTISNNIIRKQTLNKTSVQSVIPCVMTGSCSSVRPSQQSSSMQRQPANRACLYISTDDFPVN